MMSEYSRSVMIDATAHHVFSFVSTVGNLPKYLPTVRHAKAQGDERVEVDGAAHGHDYHSDGYFKVDKDHRSLTWGSDGENDYSGHLEVHASGEQASRVTCTLHFNPKPSLSTAMESQPGGRDAAINDGLEAALQSIKNECEGAGGKVHTAAEH